MPDRGVVTLREVLESDLPALFAHQADPVGAAMAGFESRAWEAFLEHWHRILADPRVICRVVLLDDAVVGNIGSFDQDGLREVGYWVDREVWGRGIASAALAQFLDVEVVRPLHAVAVVGNAGSLRVLAKCGFVVESQDDEEAVLVLH